MSGISRSAGFPCSELSAPLHEAPEIGIPPAHFDSIDVVNIEGRAAIVPGLGTVRPARQLGHPKGISLPSKNLQGPQHAGIEIDGPPRGSLVTTPMGSSPRRGVPDVVDRGRTVVTPTDMEVRETHLGIVQERTGESFAHRDRSGRSGFGLQGTSHAHDHRSESGEGEGDGGWSATHTPDLPHELEGGQPDERVIPWMGSQHRLASRPS